MIRRLSHAVLAVTDLGRAKEFYCDLLGFIVFAEADEALWLRAPDEFDVWSLKLTREPEYGLLTFGFRVGAEEDLDSLERLHESLELPTRWLAAGDEPGRGRMLRVRTPGGLVADFGHEVEEVPTRDEQGPRLPMRQARSNPGIGLCRLDHVNVRVDALDAALAYWQGQLKFSPSERQLDDAGNVQRAWLRRNPNSHDMAIGRDTQIGLHHIAYTLRDTSALIAAADRISDAGWSAIEYGPGRHGITDACFLYIRDPDGNRIELYTGDYVRDLDRPPIDWTLEQYQTTGLLWWGQQPPASFLEAGPVVERSLVADLSQVMDAPHM